MKKYFICFFIFLLFSALISCNNNSPTKTETQINQQESILLVKPTPVESESEYIASAQTITFKEGLKGIYYKEFLKNPHKLKGTRISVVGKIFKIEEVDGQAAIQVYISRHYDNVIVYYKGTTTLYKDDLVKIYGEGAGVFEGKNAFGATITAPLINARYLKKVKNNS